ncbi:tyrosine-type recombinase/integrase [Massilia sp. CMS3.1]|uniref:tyrosine-type recombinase/integrase n=1 Tax=Massilia sp. CMS3.1 TaxID=3373083 RepID=UPI003EE6868F
MEMKPYRLELIRPSTVLPLIHDVRQEFDLGPFEPTMWRTNDVPLIAAILNRDNKIHWLSTTYLAERALESTSLTGDTVRSYGYSLVLWLNYLSSKNLLLELVTEADLQIFRNTVWNRNSGFSEPRQKAYRSTVIARVETARRFHEWGQSNGKFFSPLGMGGPMRYTLPPEQRLPKIVKATELKNIIGIAPEPYNLAFKWAVTAGLRRFELCGLSKGQVESLTYGDLNEIGEMDVYRKGGRLITTYFPNALLHDTIWYIQTSRPTPKKGMEDVLFLSPNGYKLQREEISRVFRRCADKFGIGAVLHHLRHTFAVTTLEILQRKANAGGSVNPLKTLQILMGHRSLESTQIYLRAMDVYSDEVAEALSFLYGAASVA